MVMLRVDNSMAGGVRCEHCKRYDTFVVMKTEVRWQPVIRVFTSCRCAKCGYRETFVYEPVNVLKYDMETNSYRFTKIEKNR